MAKHELKIEKKYFEDVLSGIKKFEIRYNDRNFKVGDTFVLKEIDTNKIYTGRSFQGEITYITNFEQKDNYIVFGFKRSN